ncbi:MAG: CAP domain-containing protein [Caldilinea sp.]|nr:CAP domain-containing protein [Caldilinea sp.]MDW8442768.1 CAP domain-containing protein [Caldilineaceae bacterium]
MNRKSLARSAEMCRQGAIGVAVILLLSCLATAPSIAATMGEVTFTGCGGADAPVVNRDYEARVVELVNRERAAHGISPLKRTAALEKAARYHAADLGLDNYFSHDTYDRNNGALVRVCGAFERIRAWYNYWAAAENVAAGYRTPEAVMEGWLNSEGHRRNILNPDLREIGVGYFSGGGDYGVYWVQDFGSRRDVYPMIINNDALTTDNREVNIFIYGEWGEMRLRNNGGAWEAWRPFANSFAWTLDDRPGEQIISAELRKGSQTYATCSRITLVTAGAAAFSDEHQIFLPAILGDAQPQTEPPSQESVVCEW